MNIRLDNLVTSWMLGTMATLTLVGSVSAFPDCDDRITNPNTTRYPWNTIATLRYDADYDGVLGGVGSGTLITPYTVLTCGHCVYNRSEGHYNYSDIHVQPGAYRDGSDIIHPYGTRIADHKHTNSKWADTSYTPRGDVDYGALHIICSFPEIDTFMAVRFDYVPENVNMCGYPVEDLPDSSSAFDQWWAYDAVTDVESRRIWYDVRSTGGASGSPDWIYYPESGERYIVAVNRAHSTDCNGIGTRLVWNNETLIRDWMSWEPTFEEKLEAGCAFEIERLPWDFIAGHFMQNPSLLIPVDALRLSDPLVPPPAQPAARIFQVIGNTFYEWEEYQVEPQDPGSGRFLRMVKPEQKWLSVHDAQILLTASTRWVDEVPPGNNTTKTRAGNAFPIPMAIDDDPAGPVDQSPDDRGPEETAPCPGDLDGDGTVGLVDLLQLLAVWGGCSGPDCPQDLDGDSTVGTGDLLIIFANWGSCVG